VSHCIHTFMLSSVARFSDPLLFVENGHLFGSSKVARRVNYVYPVWHQSN